MSANNVLKFKQGVTIGLRFQQGYIRLCALDENDEEEPRTVIVFPLPPSPKRAGLWGWLFGKK